MLFENSKRSTPCGCDKKQLCRRRAGGVDEGFRSIQNLSHPFGGRIKLDSAGRIACFDCVERSGRRDDFALKEFGECLAGDVVGGGTEAAAYDHDVRAVERFTHGGLNDINSIRNCGVARKNKPDGG